MRLSLQRILATTVMMALPLGALAQPAPNQRPMTGMQRPGGGKAPYAGAAKMSTEQALLQAPKMDPGLAPLDKEFKAAQANLKKHPKDAKAKKAYVETAYKYGHTTMMDQGKLPPPIQYRAALALYRKALAVDPKHKPSLDDKNLIERIYAQMGMPIPK